MLTAQKVVQNSEFVHQFKGGGMNRISAKIAQKIRVLFKHNHIHSGPGEQEAEHHTRGSTARNAAARFDGFSAVLLVGHCGFSFSPQKSTHRNLLNETHYRVRNARRDGGLRLTENDRLNRLCLPYY